MNVPLKQRLLAFKKALFLQMGLAVAYFVMARLGLMMATINNSASPVWPATGFAFAALFLFGKKTWPAIATGAFFANALTGNSLLSAAIIAIGNTLEAWVGAYLLSRVMSKSNDFEYQSETMAITAASLLASICSATIGTSALLGTSVIPKEAFWHVWTTWWVGDALGGLVVTPFLIRVHKLFQQQLKINWKVLLQSIATGLSLALVIWFVFYNPKGSSFLFVIFPVLLGIAYFLGVTGVRITTFLLSIACIWATIRNFGPFTGGKLNENLVHLQLFLAALAITGLMLAGFLRAKTLKLPAIVLILCWTLSGGLFYSFEKNEKDKDRLRFSNKVEDVHTALVKRIETYEETLRAGVALFDASYRVESKEWGTFFSSLKIMERYPGVHGLGVVSPIPTSELRDFQKKMRATESKDFTIKFLRERVFKKPVYDQDTHYIIKYIWPLEGNLPALGIDLSSEKKRLQAADLARDTGKSAITSKIALFQDAKKRPGFLLFLPIYKKSRPLETLEQRRNAFKGWVYAPFIAEKLFEGALGTALSELDVMVFDDSAIDPKKIIYNSNKKVKASITFDRVTTLDIGQRQFTIGWQRGSGFVTLHDTIIAWMSLCGALLSLFLAGMVVNLQTIGSRSKEIATQLTLELKRSEETFRLLVQGVSDYAIFMLDPDGKILTWNEGAERLNGYTSTEIIGHHFSKFYSKEDIEIKKPENDLEIAKETGKFEETGWRLRKDGFMFYTHILITRITDDKGNLLGFGKVARDLTQYRTIETQRQELLDRLNLALSSAQMAAWSIDLKTLKAWRSEKHDEIFGHRQPLPDWSHEVFINHVIPEDRPRIESEFKKTLKAGFATSECRIQRADDGAIRWLSINSKVFVDTNFQPVHMMGIVRDITDRKAEESERMAAHAWQKALLDSANYSIISTDTNGIIYTFNAAAEKMLGYTAEEVVEKTTLALIHEPSEIFQRAEQLTSELEVSVEPGFDAFFAKARIKKIPDENEWTYIRKDGSRFPVSLSVTALTDSKGTVTGYLGIASDITEKKKAIEQLQITNDRLTRVIQATNVGIWERDLVGPNTYVDATCKALMGIHKNTELDRDLVISRYRPEDVEKMTQIVQKHVEGKTPLFSCEGRFRRLDNGEERWLHATGYAVRDQNGNPTKLLSTVSDVTERKHSEEALRNALEKAQTATVAKSAFLANMSHEIRTPLNGIIGMADLILETKLNSDQKKFAEIIQQSGTTLLTLINDILDFSKIEAGKLDIEKTTFTLSQLVENQADLLLAKAKEKNISLMTFISPKLPALLSGDPGRIGQVLLNLIGNAIKFTSSGGVAVRVFDKNQGEDVSDITTVRFEIEDTGIGISRDDQIKLFQPFTQADGKIANKYGGTGLGLSISKRLVEAMGGQIGLESTLGEGSQFWFDIPLLAADTMDSPQKRIDSEDLHDLRALVVDDDTIALDTIHRYFTSWQMRDHQVSSFSKVIEVLKAGVKAKDPYQVAIIGHGLKNNPGVLLGSEIMHTLGPDAPKLLLMVHHGKLLDVGTIKKNHFQNILYKPIKQSDLFDSLMSIFHRQEDGSPASNIEIELPEKPKNVSHLKILVADDVIANQMLTVKLLESLGYSANVVANGKEVLEALDRIPYDLILMDCQMPEMDGFEATQEIRKKESSTDKRTPIIALTANAMSGDDKKCIDAGMDDYLAKPIKKETLGKMLQKWLFSKNSKKQKSVA